MLRFRWIGTVAGVVVLLVLGVASIPAQQVVSVKAGFLHFSEGEVFVNDKEVKHDAARRVHVSDGQRLKTGKGRAEMMFAMGALIRLDENSELEMVKAGTTSSSVRLVSGSAIVAAGQVTDKDSLALLAGDKKLSFVESGYYRIDARDGQAPTVKVTEGKTVVSLADEASTVKSKRALTFSGAPPEWILAKFDRKDKDGLDHWSEARAVAIKEQLEAMMASGKLQQQNEAAQSMYKDVRRMDQNRARNSINRPAAARR